MKRLVKLSVGPLLGALLAACGTQGGTETVTADPCSVHVRPSSDDQMAIQSALLGAAAGSVICLHSGEYQLTDGLSLGVPGLTLRAMDRDVVFDFARQRAAAPGLDITGDDVALESVEVRNANGTAVRIVGADNVRVSDLRIGWERDVDTSAGTRGISLIEASNTLLKDVEVSGADVGVRAIATRRLVIDGASLRGNGVGVQVEGGADLEVMGTALQGNRVGLLAQWEEAGGGERLKVHNNLIEGSGTVEDAPRAHPSFEGAGLVVFGPLSMQIDSNTIRANQGPGLLVAPRASAQDDKQLSLHVHDNRLEGNGQRADEEEEGAEEALDILLLDLEAPSLCFAENVGTVGHMAEGEPASDAADVIDASCPMAPLPSITL